MKVNYATWQEKEKTEQNAINYLSSDRDKRDRSYHIIISLSLKMAVRKKGLDVSQKGERSRNIKQHCL